MVTTRMLNRAPVRLLTRDCHVGDDADELADCTDDVPVEAPPNNTAPVSFDTVGMDEIVGA